MIFCLPFTLGYELELKLHGFYNSIPDISDPSWIVINFNSKAYKLSRYKQKGTLEISILDVPILMLIPTDDARLEFKLKGLLKKVIDVEIPDV